MKNCFIASSILLKCACSLSSAAPDISETNVDALVELITGTTNDYNVEITQLDTGAASFTIDVTDPNDRIINLEIKKNASLGSGQSIVMYVDAGGFDQESDLSALVNVISHPDVELILKNVNMAGDFGQSDLTDPGYMEFDEVESVFIKGNWYADVIVDDRFGSVGLTIDRVNFSGDVLDGGLEYYNGDMPFFTQRETTPGQGDMLGTVAEPIYIRATGGFEQLSVFNAIEVDFSGLVSGVHPRTNWLRLHEKFESSTAMTLQSLGGEANFFNHPGGLTVGDDYGVNLTVIEVLPTSTPGTTLVPIYTIGRTMLAGSELNLPADGLTT